LNYIGINILYLQKWIENKDKIPEAKQEENELMVKKYVIDHKQGLISMRKYF
jgi:hypothetical protein